MPESETREIAKQETKGLAAAAQKSVAQLVVLENRFELTEFENMMVEFEELNERFGALDPDDPDEALAIDGWRKVRDGMAKKLGLPSPTELAAELNAFRMTVSDGDRIRLRTGEWVMVPAEELAGLLGLADGVEETVTVEAADDTEA